MLCDFPALFCDFGCPSQNRPFRTRPSPETYTYNEAPKVRVWQLLFFARHDRCTSTAQRWRACLTGHYGPPRFLCKEVSPRPKGDHVFRRAGLIAPEGLEDFQFLLPFLQAPRRERGRTSTPLSNPLRGLVRADTAGPSRYGMANSRRVQFSGLPRPSVLWVAP